MTEASYTPAVAEKIDAARQVSGRDYTKSLVNWTNFGALFEHQAQTFSNQTYLIYRDGTERAEYSYKDFYTRCSS